MSITLQLAASATLTWRDARIAGPGRGVDLLAQRDLVGERDQAQRIVGAVHRLVGALRRRSRRARGGSSSFSVAAARSIAASLISLAWAKAVVSPVTPRRPKPGAGVIVGGLQPTVVEPERLAGAVLKVELAIVVGRQMLGREPLRAVGIEAAVEEPARVGAVMPPGCPPGPP